MQLSGMEDIMKTAIMTDSNSGILADKSKELGIYLLPMPVLVEKIEFSEGKNITSQELYEYMEAKKNCSTSQPSPGDLKEMWDKILNEGYDEIVYIPMSSSLSGSCQSAKMLAEDYGSRVHVVDNHRISVSQMESALEAKRMADAGKNAENIKAYLEETANNASIYLMVDSLKYLKKSGRMDTTTAIVGTLLNIKPILSIQGEKLIPHETKIRGIKNCEKKMIESLKYDLETRFKDIPVERLRFATAGTLKNVEDAENWRMIVESALGQPVYYDNLPCSIACHIGPECKGIGVTIVDGWKN